MFYHHPKLILILLGLSYSDWRYKTVPLLGLIVGYSWILWGSTKPLTTQLLDAFIGFIVPYAIRWVYQLLRKQEGMGLGDPIVIALISLESTYIVAFQAFIMATWLSCIHWLIHPSKPKTIALIPYLSIATILNLVIPPLTERSFL